MGREEGAGNRKGQREGKEAVGVCRYSGVGAGGVGSSSCLPPLSTTQFQGWRESLVCICNYTGWGHPKLEELELGLVWGPELISLGPGTEMGLEPRPV